MNELSPEPDEVARALKEFIIFVISLGIWIDVVLIVLHLVGRL